MTPQEAEQLWKRRRAKIEKRLQQEGRAIGLSALKFTKDYMTRTIYAIPEDKVSPETMARRKAALKNPKLSKEQKKNIRALGDKKWRRTGHLRRSEKMEVRENGFVVAIVNTAEYSVPRHEYGKHSASREAAGKKQRAFNPSRVSHWRDELEKTFQPSVLPDWRQAVLDVLQDKV